MRGKGRIDSQLEVKEIVLGMLDKYPYTTAKMILEELAAANERGLSPSSSRRNGGCGSGCGRGKSPIPPCISS